MTPLTQAPQVIFGFVRRIFTYENGALILLAAPTSDFMIKVLREIFSGVASRDYALPFLCAAVGLMLYFSIFSFDFFTGIRASRHEAENKSNYIKSEKLWSSMWKISVVFLIVFFLTIFSVLLAVIGLSFFHSVFMYATVVFCIMASLFDLHSIGENHLRRFKKKPPIFLWLDEVTKAVNEGFIKKLKGLF